MISKVLLLALVCLGCAWAAVLKAEQEGMRLIEVAPETRIWVSEEQLEEIDRTRHQINKLGVGYFDVTDFQEPVKKPVTFERRAFPTAPAYQSIVNPLLAEISRENIESFIQDLSQDFTTRYYTTAAGVQSANYLRNLMQSFVDAAGRTDANCTLFSHTWEQPSVICRIEGQGDFADEVVVTGAHLDSVNSRSVPNGVSPGADDDATGVASFIETFRILIESGFKPDRSLEFMAYAAEEVGLRGSQAIARAYAVQGKNVYAVYQNEMSGYVEESAQVTILQDYVDADLTRFVEALVDEYLEIPYTRAICGYGCSDHASWEKEGYATVCTAEAGPFGDVNPNMHTANDTLDKLDMDFTTEFGKLCLAFMVELGLIQ